MDLIKFSDLIDKGSFDKGIRAIVEDLELITVAIEESKDAADEFAKIIGKQLKKEIASLSSTSKKLAKDMADMENKMKQFKQTTSNTNKVISDYEKANKKLEKELAKVKKELAQVNTETKKTAQTTASASKANKTMAQTLLGIGGGAALAYRAITVLRDQLRLAVQSTLEFEQAMKEVQAITRASAEDLRLLTENANRLGATTEKTAGMIAKLQKELGKLGFNTTEILASTDAIVDLSTATGEDLAGSATVAAATLRAFGLEAVEMGRVVDVMAGSFVRSGLDLEKFRESMKLVAPIARATNVDIETTTAMLSKLADAGLSGSLAGTALRNLLSSMADPSEKLVKFLGQLNSNLSDGVKTSEDAILAFKELKASGIGLAEAVQMVDVRARPAFFTIMNQIEAVEGLTLEYGLLNGEANDIAETMRDTLSNDIKIAESAFDALRRNITEKFNPSMRTSAQLVATYSEALRLLIDDISELDLKKSKVGSFFAELADDFGITALLKGLQGVNKLVEQYVSAGKYAEELESVAINLGEIEKNVQGLDKVLEINESFETSKQPLNDYLKALSGYKEITADIAKSVSEKVITEEEGYAILKKRVTDYISQVSASLNQQETIKQTLEKQLSIHRSIHGDLTNDYIPAMAGLEEKQTQQLSLVNRIEEINKFLTKNSGIRLKLESLLTKELKTQLDLDSPEDVANRNKQLEKQLKLEQQLQQERLKNELELLKIKQLRAKTEDESKQVSEDILDKELEIAKAKYEGELEMIELTTESEKQAQTERLLAWQKYYNEVIKLTKGSTENDLVEIEKATEDTTKIIDRLRKEASDNLKKLYEESQERNKNKNEQEVQDEQEKWDNIQKTAQVAARGLSRITTSIFDNRQLARENELEAIRQWEDRRLALVGDNERAQLVIKEETARREKAIRVQQAKDNKAEAMFQIIIDTAQAVMATLGQTGAFGIPLSAIVGALGAAQLAVVASQPLPQFAKGTKNSPEGLAEVGERGRELIVDGKTGRVRMAETRQVDYLTKGSIVVPNAQTEAMLSGQSIDRNSIAFEALSKISPRKSPVQTIDYDKLGNVIVNGIKNVPKNETYFDENGVRNYIVKGSMRLQKLNKRRGY
jgi:TP901 family phage tail tape measure protein